MKTYKYQRGVLVNGDSLKLMRKVKDRSVDLVFSDPPFNIGWDYDSISDKMTPEEYKAWTFCWVSECYRVLKPTGSIFVAIGDEYVADIKRVLDDHFGRDRMRNWIIWYYTFGVYCKGKFGRDHAHILYYTRGKSGFTFNGDAIRVPSARQVQYGDKRADPKGRVPGDVWTFPRVCGTFKERTGHPCQMPESILDRVIKVASDEGNVVLDPFAGSGTTLAVAEKLKRRWIGFELSANYCDGIRGRLAKIGARERS